MEINLKKEELFSKVKSILTRDYLYVTVLGWNDMDYFEELCQENGGCSDDALSIFYNLPLAENVLIKDFEDFIKKYLKYPFLESDNKKIKFNYDLHMWTTKYYLVYNFYLEKMIIKEMNFIEKIFKKTTIPSWQC